MEKSMKIMAGEIFAGLVVHNLLCAAAAWFFFRQAPVFAGLFLGMVCGGLMLLHMAFCLERAARAGGSREAGRRTASGVALRAVCYGAVMVVILWKFSDRINVLAVAVGALGLKTGAYLQPVFHRICRRRAGGEETAEDMEKPEQEEKPEQKEKTEVES